MSKPPVSKDGLKPMTKLKTFVRNNPLAREELMALTDEMESTAWIVLVNQRFGFGLGPWPAVVTEFRKYVDWLRSMDHQNDRMEALKESYREKFPTETDEELDARAMLHFKRDSVETGDQKAYIEIKSLQLLEQTARTKAAQKEKEIAQKDTALQQNERKILMLETKLRNAQAVIDHAKNTTGGITPETLEKIERELKLL